MDLNEFRRLLFLSTAVSVPSTDYDTPLSPGQIFIDEWGTAGNAVVELVDGGITCVALEKNKPYPAVIKQVLTTYTKGGVTKTTTAVGILLNPINYNI